MTFESTLLAREEQLRLVLQALNQAANVLEAAAHRVPTEIEKTAIEGLVVQLRMMPMVVNLEPTMNGLVN